MFDSPMTNADDKVSCPRLPSFQSMINGSFSVRASFNPMSSIRVMISRTTVSHNGIVRNATSTTVGDASKSRSASGTPSAIFLAAGTSSTAGAPTSASATVCPCPASTVSPSPDFRRSHGFKPTLKWINVAVQAMLIRPDSRLGNSALNCAMVKSGITVHATDNSMNTMFLITSARSTRRDTTTGIRMKALMAIAVAHLLPMLTCSSSVAPTASPMPNHSGVPTAPKIAEKPLNTSSTQIDSTFG
mmetsp:Transcript_29682/g.65247  ORF Transcript_29682/g.65247 Transcript_29682/m.65247 type:complete len:245 (-) Transcript_29682:258-992(-)